MKYQDSNVQLIVIHYPKKIIRRLMKETLKHQNAMKYGLPMYHIAAGKLYLSPILDLHNREIVTFNISTSPNFEQTKDMLSKAFNK